MRNHIIFSFVGAIVLFMYQFLSWAAINLHSDQQKYTPLEYELLQCFETSGLEPGMYAVGQGNPANGQEAMWAEWTENFKGKPWAVINYIESNDMDDMVGNMSRSLLVNLFAAALLFFILSKTNVSGLKDTSILLIGMGLLAFITEPYTYSIWYKMPGMKAHLIDAIVPWFILAFLYTKLRNK